MAQNVYSVNIVGYVNVPLAASQQALVATPLDDGTNTLTDLGAGWSNGTAVQVWNGSGFNGSQKLAGSWGAGGSTVLAPGTGYFVKGTKAQTLTFVGSAPTSNNYVLVNKVQVLAGSVIPFSGALSDAGANTININSFSNGTAIQIWGGSAFTGYQKLAGSWGASPPTIGVAQGFFVKPGSAVPNTWQQVLQ